MPLQKKKKILLISHNLDDFVGQDLAILQKHYEVRTLPVQGQQAGFLGKLVPGIKWCDLCFIWFAANYAAIATVVCRIFGKKSIIIAGGYDTVNMPDIQYGLLTSKKTAWYPKIALKYADKVLAFSEASRKDILENFTIAEEKVETVYLFIEPRKYPAPKKAKEQIVITIGEIRQSTIYRKGLETFVRAAGYLPKTQFILIGKPVDDTITSLKKMATKNVEFAGFLSFSRMLKLMQKAKVYCQLSAHEGFGFSLAEAMLCECIPVCSTRGSLPEVGGKTAYYVPYGDAKMSAEAIRKALEESPLRGKKAREHILKNFPLRKRENLLVRHINTLLHA
ncbi:MAG: glycosyltransferase family 4 protein [Nanoarchaeota archaeon]